MVEVHSPDNMVEVHSPVKETFPSAIMYLDRVRSETLLKFNVLYWGLKYKELEYEECYIRYAYSLKWFLVFTKERESVTVVILTKDSRTVVQGFIVFQHESKVRQQSLPVFAKEIGDRRYKIEFPISLIQCKRNKILRKCGCLVLGISCDPRRLLNVQIGLHVEDREEKNNFIEAYEKQLFTDFTIRSNGEKFHVHRAILAARSIHFYKNMENRENEMVVDATPKAVRNVVHYMYSGELPTCTLNELIDVFEVSVRLSVPSLTDQCTVYFLDVLNKDNVGRIRDAAIRTRSTQLITATNQY